jgi:integrase
VRALEALERIRYGANSPLLFQGERGGYLDIHHFRTCQRPAQMAAGVKPIRRVYDLRHTFDVRAPCRNLNLDLSRSMGASLTNTDRHYGHLARDGR